MASLPKVSVILPTYNRENLVGKSIQSILAQSFRDFELIIIDDGSKDGTEAIIKGLTDPRIVYLKHAENKGGAAARNTGIDVAKGKFIAFQDSDDIWLPDKLEKQMALFEKSPESVGIVYTQCSRWNVDQEKRIPGDLPNEKEGFLFHTLLPDNFITLPSVVMKRECIEKAGRFDEALPRLQDWEFFLRVAKHFEFRYIPEPLVQSYYTEGSISSNPLALIKAYEIVYEKYFDEYKNDRNLHADQLIRISNRYRFIRDIKRSRKYLIDAFKISPKPYFMLATLASFLGVGFFNLYWRLVNKISGLKKR